MNSASTHQFEQRNNWNYESGGAKLVVEINLHIKHDWLKHEETQSSYKIWLIL